MVKGDLVELQAAQMAQFDDNPMDVSYTGPALYLGSAFRRGEKTYRMHVMLTVEGLMFLASGVGCTCSMCIKNVMNCNVVCSASGSQHVGGL